MSAAATVNSAADEHSIERHSAHEIKFLMVFIMFLHFMIKYPDKARERGCRALPKGFGLQTAKTQNTYFVSLPYSILIIYFYLPVFYCF